MSDNQYDCDNCVYYVWDDDWECYICAAGIDEDDMSRLISGNTRGCPYYRYDDEYGVVRKQN
ncbi:MAG: hypothetical protein E7559_01985 [Ruminococcaceae bacterium]|nr:hypothetical protein [Oscillospiraceae bacterium]